MRIKRFRQNLVHGPIYMHTSTHKHTMSSHTGYACVFFKPCPFIVACKRNTHHFETEKRKEWKKNGRKVNIFLGNWSNAATLLISLLLVLSIVHMRSLTSSFLSWCVYLSHFVVFGNCGVPESLRLNVMPVIKCVLLSFISKYIFFQDERYKETETHPEF